MTYLKKIEKLISNINTTLVDFDTERKRGTMPTQVSSDFLTNKEQGDWAEKTLLNVINQNSTEFVAVKYGRDDNIVAGEDDFKEFYANYQSELDDIGKRPDILIFAKKDFPYESFNISKFSREILDDLVPKAKCGIEVRSSAFLINKYESFMNEKQSFLVAESLRLREIILSQYGDLLYSKDAALYKLIETLSADNLHIMNFKSRSWRSTEELCQLSSYLKDLKTTISGINKRTFLSITPKAEDLKVVYTWIKKYNVPHYYIQVFFDKAYGISFEKILSLLGTPELEGNKYFIETDIKNQQKVTVKIKANEEENILEKVSLPEHFSEMKELDRGRLLFYVKFKESVSYLNTDAFARLFGFEL